jgi:hypothetical protein
VSKRDQLVAELSQLEQCIDAAPDPLLLDPTTWNVSLERYPLPAEIKNNPNYIRLANMDNALFAMPLKSTAAVSTKRRSSLGREKRKSERKKNDKYHFYAWQLKVKSRPLSEHLPTSNYAITTKDWQVCLYSSRD